MPDGEKPPLAMRPCPFALAAMSVPARRWETRTDLVTQLKKAEDLMRADPAEELSLEVLARESGISVHHFARLFHEVYGVPPREYLAQMRLESAMTRLAGTSASVSEIAMEVGFVNASAFSRFFRRRVGQTPSEYRRSPQPAAL